MAFNYKKPADLTPLEAELEANAGDMEWYDEFSAREKGPDGRIPEERCKEIRGSWASMIQKTFHHQLEPLQSTLDETLRAVKHLEGKYEGVDRRVNDHSQRISLLESGMANIALNQAQVIEMVKMGNSHTETIAGGMSDMREMLVDIAKKHINQTAPKPPLKSKTAWLASVPAIGYVVAGVVSIAFISAATGHLSDFFAYLSTVKVFGGVK
jgi:hypothetical protein